MSATLNKQGNEQPLDIDDKGEVIHSESIGTGFAQIEGVEASLSWRTWIAVFLAAFVAFAQLLSITGPANIISFIIQDLGRPDLAGWIIQAPTIVQGSLSPFVGRLSDDIGRRWIVIICPILSCVGAIICVTAQSMETLICGKVIGGLGLTAVGLITSIPSEVLPSRLRPVGQSTLQIAGSLAGIVASLGSGALVGASPSGWRNLFYIEIALTAVASIGFFFTYHPAPRSLGANKTWGEILHSCDPVGCILIAISFTCIILGINFGSSTYTWKNAHFYGPLIVGLLALVALVGYEWKGRSDGIIHHRLFDNPRNYSIAAFTLFVEGWIYFSGIAAYFPQEVRYLGWESRPFYIGVRKFIFNATCICMVIPVTFLSTRFKDCKWILSFAFSCFLISICCFASAGTDSGMTSIAFIVIAGIGMAPQLILLVMVAQFSSPPALIATATSLVATIRAVGGALGSSIMGSQVNQKTASEMARVFVPAALANGLPASSVPGAVAAFRAAVPARINAIPGMTPQLVAILTPITREAYAYGFKWAWISLIPITTLGLVAMLCLDQRSIRERMNKKIDATLEKSDHVLVAGDVEKRIDL